MNRRLWALALALVLLPAPAVAGKIEPDKLQHAGVSFVLGFAAGNQWPDNKPLAFGVAMVPGLIKEISDSRQAGNEFSGKDMLANAIGAALGVYTSHWIIARQSGQTVIAYRTPF